MTAEELRNVITYLEQQIHPGEGGISFETTAEEMIAAGLDPDGVRKLVSMPWWDEMKEDVCSTPEFCEPEDTAEQILAYARDVVGEYVRKRFSL